MEGRDGVEEGMSRATEMSSGRRVGAAFCVALSLALLLPALARADGPLLTVSDLGQSSAPVEVGQPPFEVPPRGSCIYPFTMETESACPAGTWPLLGERWGSIEDVAGGDALRLEFAAPVSAVTIASTSNYVPGLHDPDGNPIPNYDVIAESSATPTSDPRIWQATLPQLDARAISTNGDTFSVVAQDGSGHHDYAFGIRSPRFENESTLCGRAWYSTDFGQYLCPSRAGGGSPPAKILRVGAAYDGRVLILHVEVPEAGRLSIAVPTKCASTPGADCHRKTILRRTAKRRGTIVIKRPLDPRFGPPGRITLRVRFEMATSVSIGKLTPKVHLRGEAAG
jgi:hypothetical protein